MGSTWGWSAHVPTFEKAKDVETSRELNELGMYGLNGGTVWKLLEYSKLCGSFSWRVSRIGDSVALVGENA